jgi:Uma2 family endonuclease
VIEVAQTSFAFDRDTKASLYARHQIPEYWIVDLVSKSVIVHRCPMDDRYTEEATFSRAHTITPLAVPVLEVNLADIL